MIYKDTFGIWVFFIIPYFSLNNCKDPYDDPSVRLKFAQFHCYKLRTCTAGGGKVCGFDEYSVKLAEFEDTCTLHKVNCDGIGMYLIVERHVCTQQKEFEEENNITDAHFSKFTTNSPSNELIKFKF